MKRIIFAISIYLAMTAIAASQTDLSQRVDQIYDDQLAELFLWFHQHPELSFMEHETSRGSRLSWRLWATTCTQGLVVQEL